MIKNFKTSIAEQSMKCRYFCTQGLCDAHVAHPRSAPWEITMMGHR